jgi:translation initiation factor IF-2
MLLLVPISVAASGAAPAPRRTCCEAHLLRAAAADQPPLLPALVAQHPSSQPIMRLPPGRLQHTPQGPAADAGGDAGSPPRAARPGTQHAAAAYTGPKPHKTRRGRPKLWAHAPAGRRGQRPAGHMSINQSRGAPWSHPRSHGPHAGTPTCSRAHRSRRAALHAIGAALSGPSRLPHRPAGGGAGAGAGGGRGRPGARSSAS